MKNKNENKIVFFLFDCFFLSFRRKSKVLADQYQLLVDQRQNEIDRLRKTLDEKSSLVERVEKTSQDEVKEKF